MLAILLGTLGPVAGQTPPTPPSEEINPALAPGGAVQLEPAPTQSAVEQEVIAPEAKPRSWFDNLFTQKLPVQAGFHLGESYSDNIFFQPHKSYDYITDISATLGVTLGTPIPLAPQLDQETLDLKTKNDAGDLNYFHVSGTPKLILYDKHSGLDDVDEDVDAIYTHQFGRLTLSLEQTYEKLSQPTIQVNAQGALINRDIFTTTARANYIYSDKLSTYGTLTQTWNKYISTAYTDNTQWEGDYYFLYQLFPKMSLGFGPRIGWEDIDREANQSYQGGLVHLYFLATGKFTLAAAAGAELREFQDDASPTKVTPIFEATATYQPFDSMTIKLDGERHRIVANGQPGDDYTATVVTLEARQRLFQIIYLTLSGGYENDDYTVGGTGAVGVPARSDDIYFARAGLEWASFRGIKFDLSDEYIRDESNIKAFSFNQNRATVSGTFTY